MNNGVGYARPAAGRTRSSSAPTAIGADMLEEVRLAYAACGRTTSGDGRGCRGMADRRAALVPRVTDDRVTWNYEPRRLAGNLAFTPAAQSAPGRGRPAKAPPRRRPPDPRHGDLTGARARAAEAVRNRLHARL